MKLESQQIYHVYNRGNNRQKIFFEDDNYRFFLKKMRFHLLRNCNLIGYCLMPNHFHWMIYLENDDLDIKINQEIGVLLRSYTRAINNRRNRTGSLFQQTTKFKTLEEIKKIRKDADFDLYRLLRYVHCNPVKAELVSDPSDWEFSSYNFYKNDKPSSLINEDFVKRLLDLNQVEYLG